MRGVLDDDMKRVVREQRLGYVASVCPDGTPNLSPKGTTAVWDDDHLVFLDIFSPGTVANIEAGNRVVEVNVVDPIRRKGYRFKGPAEVHGDGSVFEDVVRLVRAGARQRRESREVGRARPRRARGAPRVPRVRRRLERGDDRAAVARHVRLDAEVAVTYSIVARDDATGQLGVAVQTAMFAVGAVVPSARPGVGAVASQAMGEAAYGPRCLDALAAGSDAAGALAAAQAEDAMAVLRQVGVVGADGSVASTTGSMCIDHAGDVVGDGFAVQANMMSTPDVWPAMASEFAGSSGPLERRLLAALVAGEAAGGDARGRMSAALLVVEGAPPSQPGGGTVVDLRVNRSGDPVGDLSRLLDAADVFVGFSRVVDQLMASDPGTALGTVDDALVLLPDEENLQFVRAGALLASGATDAGVAELRGLIASHPSWEVIVRSFAAKGLVALPDGLSIDAVLGA